MNLDWVKTIPDTESQGHIKTHFLRWQNCHACGLHHGTHNRVLFRGYFPYDILFLGEAPGRSEDTLGYPFVGPSGRLLSAAIDHMETVVPGIRWGITNTVCCLPLDDSQTPCGLRPPHETEMGACLHRLQELISLCVPQGIVVLGAVARRWTQSEMFLSHLSRLLENVRFPYHYHPAYFKHRGIGVEHAEFKNWVGEIAEFATALLVQPVKQPKPRRRSRD